MSPVTPRIRFLAEIDRQGTPRGTDSVFAFDVYVGAEQLRDSYVG